ncbi:hypothetical protein E4U42_003135 [Claviceps africana]|uniref:Calcineurin-like phosphoesterase domain-containing protein n=1 Tax=Claviceps africana TaxID=83212 RepID=A0A8K0J7K5_9HYPO|nr:hypothetical protein E4U42_003135 [Claviceps africana]
MSYRRVVLSTALVATAIFTIPLCLPYLAPSASRPLITPSQPAWDAPPLTILAGLPREYVPTAGNRRRLLLIGDIHGMNTDLGHLLDSARYDVSRDHVVALGDMINRGPDSHGVVARLMGMNASAVRGNHEDDLLRALRDDDDGSVGPDRDKMLRLAATLTPEQLRWLDRLPLILAAEPLRVYLVHAGLVPGVRPDRQDPWAVMNMRTLVYPQEELRRDAQPVAVPKDDRSGEPWAKVWDRHAKHLARADRRTVVYGHDAKRGFVEGKYAVGLDSACARGGALTALVVEAGTKRKPFRYTTVQVPCKQHAHAAHAPPTPPV